MILSHSKSSGYQISYSLYNFRHQATTDWFLVTGSYMYISTIDPSVLQGRVWWTEHHEDIQVHVPPEVR